MPADPLALNVHVVRIAIATSLGLFLGLEREWSHKSAGVRTFALVSLVGTVFTILDRPWLLVVGGVLVVGQGMFLTIRGLIDEAEGLSLTTAVSMLVAYGVGILVGAGYVLEGVVVAVLSSLLLVLKRELHSFAWGLSKEEIQSVVEFAVLAFVVYPLLPSGTVDLTFGGRAVAVEPRIVWLMVVTVAGIGIVNYAIVQTYGGRGIAVTGFFGGLASSTAVVGSMLDHVRRDPAAASYALAAVLLADAAMALRNLLIAVAFTAPAVLWLAAVPLAVIVVGSVGLAWWLADWSERVDLELERPFSMRSALGFGALFLLVVLAGAVAEARLGTVGFYVTAALSGLVSSAGATTSAVLLYRGGALAAREAALGVLAATGASIAIKVALTAASPDRAFASRVAAWSAALLAGTGAVTILMIA